MELKKIYEKFDNKVHIISRRISAIKPAKRYFRMLKEHGIPIRRLTREQKKQVNEVWGGIVKGKGFATHELVLSVTGRFDPYVCPAIVFRTKIELALNDFKLKFGFSDKNYFDKLFPNEPMPKTVIRNVNGVFLDEFYKPISEQEFDSILSKYDKVIVKPSIENGFGRSVALYEADEFDNIRKDYKKNYLVQEVLRQHSSISALNESSINVMRVVSLSLNGKVTPVNCALRCGAAGAITDNCVTADGRGMFVIGVNPDGTLKNEAFHSCGERITVAPNGQNFAGLQLPNFKEALAMTTRMHEQMPHFGFIGFDVCFDEDGSPRIMELNFKGPGVLYYQYVNGALLGDRTQEVIDTFIK